MHYLPFSEMQRDSLVSQIKDMMVSTISGGVIVAIVQGILGGVAFAILAVESTIFWGSAMAIMSFVPLLGTSIVCLPASAILLFEGEYGRGIALIFIGIFVISMVDNISKTLIIGGEKNAHGSDLLYRSGRNKGIWAPGTAHGPRLLFFLSVVDIARTIEGDLEN